MAVSTPRIALLALLLGCTLADFFVAPDGHDQSKGSKDSPFATLERAQRAVRTVNTNLHADLCVHVAAGTYYLESPLNFTVADSGCNGHRILWKGEEANGGVNISGGIPLTDWKLSDQNDDIWTASTPIGLESRHFFADQQHAQRARQALNRTWLTNFTDGYRITNDKAQFLLTTPGIEHGEIRGINSFTDRYVPIDYVGSNDRLFMAQPAWQNNIIGYDSIIVPFFDNGFFVENVLAFLDEANEYYLNSSTGTIYYKPPHGADPNQMYLVLAKLEQLLLISGTYDEPVHDLTFEGFNYMHTTWNKPSSDIGYADQQTGAYIGMNISYPADLFESSRPYWYQVPGSVQASAANNIAFTKGSMTALMGGFGIGNDANAHTSGVGLGAKNIEISKMYFTQTGSNPITIGGVQADAHHPTDPRMTNKYNLITENIITDTAITYTSAAGLLVTYNTGTKISKNDLSHLPYSGICYGYGWGSNDAGGSPEYVNRGLYKYQPLYKTPTTQKDGLILQNLVRDFGMIHADLGGIYTLSASPNTNLTGNCVFTGAGGSGTAYYHDEGSRFYVDTNSVVNVTGNDYGDTTLGWFQPNLTPNQTTGNLTAYKIAVAAPIQLQEQNNTDGHGDVVYNITRWSDTKPLSPFYQQILYEAGIPPSQRKKRGVTFNPAPPL